MRLKVVADEGGIPDARSLFLRNGFLILELLVNLGVPWLLVVVLFTRYRQRLGDIFRTTVVDSRCAAASTQTPNDKPQS